MTRLSGDELHEGYVWNGFDYALQKKADMLVWGAGIQSNNCRQTAAACAKLGLECHLYLTRATHNDDVQGNLLLDYLMGAHVHIVDVPMGPGLGIELDENALANKINHQWRSPESYDEDDGSVTDW